MSKAQEILETQYELSLHERRDALKKAVDVADAEQNIDLAFRARIDLIDSLYGASKGIEQLAAFGWCLTKHDEDPTRFPLDLWYYKWVAESASSESSVSRQQVLAMLDDIEERYKKQGATPAPVLKLRLTAAMNFGEKEEVTKFLAEWQQYIRTRTGFLNDCQACDEATEASALTFLGRHDEAIKAADRLIHGNARCGSQPESALVCITESLRAVGQDKLADQCYSQGIAMIGDDFDYVIEFSNSIYHCLDRGKVEEAMDLIARSLPHIEPCEKDEFWYMRAVRKALAVARKTGMDEKEYGFDSKELAGKAEKLARAFDSRNGNTFYTYQLG